MRHGTIQARKTVGKPERKVEFASDELNFILHVCVEHHGYGIDAELEFGGADNSGMHLVTVVLEIEYTRGGPSSGSSCSANQSVRPCHTSCNARFAENLSQPGKVFVPLKRMPLNPNGKIDKPALPFPDTVQSATAAPATDKATSTEEKMHELWSKILPNAPHPLPLEESLFDLGGHSILPTRLIFEIYKSIVVVDAPLGLEEPTISGLVKAIEPITVFLAGATGFLGEGSTDSGVWDDEWVNTERLEVLTGNLRLDNFGLGDEEWNRAAEDADAMLHNGASVHWVYPYEKLRAANVISTLTAIELASTGKQKLVFVSPTSAIDTEQYLCKYFLVHVVTESIEPVPVTNLPSLRPMTASEEYPKRRAHQDREETHVRELTYTTSVPDGTAEYRWIHSFSSTATSAVARQRETCKPESVDSCPLEVVQFVQKRRRDPSCRFCNVWTTKIVTSAEKRLAWWKLARKQPSFHHFMVKQHAFFESKGSFLSCKVLLHFREESITFHDERSSYCLTVHALTAYDFEENSGLDFVLEAPEWARRRAATTSSRFRRRGCDERVPPCRISLF
ncbi:male sterility protein-domain-containing protein [Armillaria borealis]|uniref:Male sterility protein-domain-containing protein n=1 Tax=Armillaria borealis TaxID=47425 RepID=A0AA39J2T1_9AGAR|nr:male sterility protein-domain-containing protein [Armillaria borealis]